MNIINRIILYMLIPVSALTAELSESAPRIQLSIKEAEEKALAYSYDLRSAHAGRDIASGRMMVAYGQLLPKLQTTADNTYLRKPDADRGVSDRTPLAGVEASKENRASHYVETYNWAMSVEQPLYTGGRFLSSYRGAKAYLDSIEEDIRKTRAQIVYEVRKDYYTLLLYEQIVDIHRRQVEYANDFFKTTEARFHAGDVVELEMLRRKVELANEESTLATSMNNLIIARARFVLRLGLSLKTDLQLTDKLSYRQVAMGDEVDLMERALHSRAEIAKSLLEEEQRKQDIRKTQAGIFPQLSLVAAYTGNTEDFSWEGEDYRKDWSAGLKMDWNLFDRLLIRGAIREAKAMLEQQRFATLKLKDNIRLEIRMALLNLFSSMERVLSEEQNVTQAKRIQEQELTSWKEGAGETYLSVLEARRSQARAEQNYYTSLRDYNISLADLRYAVGEDDLEEK